MLLQSVIRALIRVNFFPIFTSCLLILHVAVTTLIRLKWPNHNRGAKQRL
jgi:hypothetical protein